MRSYGLDPTNTVACWVEFPKGKGKPGGYERLREDVEATMRLITCSRKRNA